MELGPVRRKIRNNSDEVSEGETNQVIFETDFFVSQLVELYKP